MSEKIDIKDQKKLVEDIASAAINNGIEKLQVRVNIDKPKIKLPPNIMVFQAFAYLAATKLKPATNSVLMLLFSQSVYENFISMDVTTIAETLQYTERSVISALNELVKNNIVIKTKHQNDKRRNDYFLNPIAAWKGNSFTRQKKINLLQRDVNQLELFNANTNTNINTKNLDGN